MMWGGPMKSRNKNNSGEERSQNEDEQKRCWEERKKEKDKPRRVK
jgi:hypothetical protein